MGCELDTVRPVVADTPGASAQREYDRRRRKREDHAREKLGSAGLLLARVIAEPQSTRAWKQGAVGEARAGARLEELLRDTDVRLLHDRRMPGTSRANIDHLAIGPGGITVIDTKNYRGKVRVDRIGGLFSPRRDVLHIDGRNRGRLIDGVERQIAAVRSVLAGTEHDSVDVRAALCFSNVDGLPLLKRQSARDVLIGGVRATAKLVRRSGPHTTAHIEQLHLHLARALQPA